MTDVMEQVLGDVTNERRNVAPGLCVGVDIRAGELAGDGLENLAAEELLMYQGRAQRRAAQAIGMARPLAHLVGRSAHETADLCLRIDP